MMRSRLYCIFIITLLLTAAPLLSANKYWQGNIGDWSNSANWLYGEPVSSDWAYVNNGGTVQITGGNNEFCYAFMLGNYAGQSGRLDVINGSLNTSYCTYVGYAGTGTLNILNGSTVNSQYGNIALDAGGLGTATVDGTGSKWINSGDLYISQHGNGILNITNGGFVSDTYSNVSYNADGVGEVNVDGTGSRWTHSDHLTLGFAGRSTMNITNGASVSNTYGEIAYQTTAISTVNVDGIDSVWTNTSYLDIGIGGHGILNITNGGSVSNTFSRVGYLGSNYNRNGTGEAYIDGVGSSWTLSDALYIGFYNNGTMSITNGGTVSSRYGRIADYSGSTGNVTVSGAGSKWTLSDYLWIGRESSGTLNINNGGEVNVGKTTWLSRNSQSGRINFDDGILTTGDLICSPDELSGTGTINTNGLISDLDLVFDSTHGSNQTFTLNKNAGQNITVNLNANGLGQIGAGNKGAGTMSVSDGVTVSSTSGLISVKAGSNGTVTVDGQGSTWANSDYIEVGLGGTGTLDVTNGGQLKSVYGEIGAYSGSTGVLTVNGSGSVWTNKYFFYVGASGNGTLNILNGGKVINTTYGHIGGYLGSVGEVTVDGAGSIWISNGANVGYEGQGTLNILHGGMAKITYLYVDSKANHKSFVNMDSGGMLALYGNGSNSITSFLNLVHGTDAIRYWDYSLSNWKNITLATYGKDYTLAYMTQGDLAGYTVLTVIPEPGTLFILGLGGLLLKRKCQFRTKAKNSK